MPSALPEGEPVPRDGSLPASAYAGLGSRPFGVYVHVPFCAVRCGYCDFNTYTADRARRRRRRRRRTPTTRGRRGAAGPPGARRRRRARGDGVLRRRHADAAAAARPGAAARRRPRRVRARCPAPRSPPRPTRTASTPASLAALRAAGFTRVSFGMQSAVPHVLATLDRTHDPEPGAAGGRAGPGRPASTGVSLDLIYGTPGEIAGRLARQPRRGARAARPTTSAPTR